MSDFLARLAERQITDTSPRVTPRLSSRFASVATAVIEPALLINSRPEAANEPATTAAPTATARLDVADVTHPGPPDPRAEPGRASGSRTPEAIELAPRPPGLPGVATSDGHMAVGETVPPDARGRDRHTPASAAVKPPPAATGPIHAEAAPARLQSEMPERRVEGPHPALLPLVPRGHGVPPKPPAPLVAMDSPPAAAAEPPVVKVTIGRVEVRAILPPPAPERRVPAPPAALSLEEYLERRHGARR